MSRIFDTIELELLPPMQETLPLSKKSCFCIGYFNLRGWQKGRRRSEIIPTASFAKDLLLCI
jgi:hypothetical protein